MKNLGNLMKQAQQMQARIEEMQAKLAEAEIEGRSGGGLVRAVMNGKGELKRLRIDPSLADPGEIEVLEDLVVAACAEARANAEALAAEEMKGITGGLPLPPGLKLF
jgi:DNA-binding YbaB/EbfC family protein